MQFAAEATDAHAIVQSFLHKWPFGVANAPAFLCGAGSGEVSRWRGVDASAFISAHLLAEYGYAGAAVHYKCRAAAHAYSARAAGAFPIIRNTYIF